MQNIEFQREPQVQPSEHIIIIIINNQPTDKVQRPVG